ncbi:MAG: aldo/keto reductase [Elusimicrobiota bacterium]|nr:aldo/keto reductase [Elusimicrobiota bacterium]
MRRRHLGDTGLTFFPVGLGAMPLSVAGRPDEARALETLAAALEAGVDFIDTANVYCLDDADLGHNERLVAKAVKASGRKGVLIATKGGLARPEGRWVNDARPAFLRESVEKSLKALGTDAIGLYQLHAPDPKVPLEDSVSELKRLQEEGKIVHIGLSNVDEEELERALKVSRVETVQNRCNPFRGEDYSGTMLVTCLARRVTYLPYGVVGGHRGQSKVGDHPLLKEIARAHGASPYAVTVAWHLAQGPAVLPIPGASRPASILDSVSAAALTLSEGEVDAITALGA